MSVSTFVVCLFFRPFSCFLSPSLLDIFLLQIFTRLTL
jgi:hypothetical protein